MAVPFRFETVLRVRVVERDRCRVALVQHQQREVTLLAERQVVSAARQALLAELQVIHDSDGWLADQVLTRQQHSEQLSTELTNIDVRLAEVATLLIRCRAELLEADTSVKSLEKLAERHESEQRRLEQATAERDREESWRAA